MLSSCLMIPRPPSSTPLSLHDALPIWLDMLGNPIEIWGPQGPSTGGAWLSSARVVRCWVKSRNERNPRSMLPRSEEHTSELQSLRHLVCRLLLEKKNKHSNYTKTSRER